MEEAKEKLKVYCETSFWSYLVGGPTADEKVARWQCLTQKWHQQEMPLCDVFVSDYVIQEARLGYTCPLIITPERYLEDMRHDL